MTDTRYITMGCRDPYRNLATEEYLMRRAEPDTVTLLLWQSERAVVIGKSQNPWKECRVEELRQDGCKFVRRSSGGGAVYVDLGDLNFTFIARRETFCVEKQTSVVLRAMELLGIDAEQNGRNDLITGGRKFSGHAYYEGDEGFYHHGTVMVDVDIDELTRYLNVSPKKLMLHGAASTRSRVTNLVEHKPGLTIDDVCNAMIRAFGDVYGTVPVEGQLPDEDDPELIELTEKFASEEWLYGIRVPFDIEVSKRYPFGGVLVQFRVNQGVIQYARIFTDALQTRVFEELEHRLVGSRYDAEELMAIPMDDLSEPEIAKTVMGLIVRDIE